MGEDTGTGTVSQTGSKVIEECCVFFSGLCLSMCDGRLAPGSRVTSARCQGSQYKECFILSPVSPTPFLLQHQSPRCPRFHRHSPHNCASCVDSQYTSYRAGTALVKANNDGVGCLRWRKATSDESINETDAPQMHPSMEANAPPLPPMQQFTCRAYTPARS